ncbi:MAG: hypothetical protein QXP46_03730 [Archaeoglobaceae archaeon]
MRKYIIVLCGVFLAVILAGCQSEGVKAKISGYEITDFNGRPAIKVSVETNKFPLTIELLGPDRRTKDLNVVDSQKDLPAILYLGLSRENVKQGTYYLLLKYGVSTLDEIELTLQGSKFRLLDKKIEVEYSEDYDSYNLKEVSLKLENVGDCPGYVHWIELSIDNGVPLARVSNEYNVPIMPGEIKTYTANFVFVSVKEPGEHSMIIKVADSGLNVVEEFRTTFTI